ncbi:MAG: hypothetical protein K8L91_04905 [Anaerolineae bacterium]|nr:hypothetical protein [Anaerolineae bacterium]
MKVTTPLHWLSRPVIFALALMLVIGAGFPTPTRAQNDPETIWYWATTPEGIVAYTLDGEINLVLPSNEFATTRLSSHFLSDNKTLLASYETFYVATPNEILLRFPQISSSNMYLYEALIYAYPYVVLWDPIRVKNGVVLNAETGQTSLLQIDPLTPRILADRHTLRYVGGLYSSDNIRISTHIFEYDLVSHTETSLYEFETDEGWAYSSADGVVWLIGYEYDYEQHTYSRIDTVGDVSPVMIDWLLQGQAVIEENLVIAFDKNCRASCSARLYPLNTDEVYRIILPHLTTPPPQLFTTFSNGSYFVQDFVGDTLFEWIYTPTGDVVSLGITGQPGLPIIPSYPFTEDQNWSLALEDLYDKYMLRIWDLNKLAISLEIPIEKSAEHLYKIESNANTILLKRDNKAWQVYDASEKVLVDISNYRDRFFQILPNGQLFYEAPEGGIYLFDAKLQTMTLLVPNGRAACCSAFMLDWEARDYAASSDN